MATAQLSRQPMVGFQPRRIAGAVHFGPNAPERATSPGWTICFWCRRRDSNPRPPHYECGALPAELQRRRARLRAKRVGLRNLWIDRLAFADFHQVTASIITKPFSSTRRTPIRYANESLRQWGSATLLHSQAKD